MKVKHIKEFRLNVLINHFLMQIKNEAKEKITKFIHLNAPNG